MDTLKELRALQRELAELGDGVAVALLERAEHCFLAWRMDEGEQYLEQALTRVQETLERPETDGPARYFNVCALAVAGSTGAEPRWERVYPGSRAGNG